MHDAITGPVGYLGPAGSWTHQACIECFGDRALLMPLAHDELLAHYRSGRIALACIPVSTSVVGATPYLDAVLDLAELCVVAEYSRMLGYSLLARPGTRREDIREVLAHPVAFEEVRPWLDREMPDVRRTAVSSGGAAAQAVARGAAPGQAAFGPKVATTLYPLVSLCDQIEEGPHNVTRWWMLGRAMPAPTGRDKTLLRVDSPPLRFIALQTALADDGIEVLSVLARPTAPAPGLQRHLLEVAGHPQDAPLAALLCRNADCRVLGACARP